MFKKGSENINKVHLQKDENEIERYNDQSTRGNMITPIPAENEEQSSSLQHLIDDNNGSTP